VTLREIIDALRRRWFVVVAGTVIAIAVGVGLLLAAGATYRVETSVLLSRPEAAAPDTAGLTSSQNLQLLAASYSEAIESPGVVRTVLEAAGLEVGDVQVRSETVKGTSVVELTVEDVGRSEAVEKAEALLDAIQDEVRTSDLGLPSADDLAAVELGETKATRASGTSLFVLFAAAATGLALSVTAVLLLESQ